MKKTSLGILVLLLSFTYAGSAQAQTSAGDAVKDFIGGIVKDKANKETGLDQIPDIKDLNAGNAADKLMSGLIGDIPSPTMGQLVNDVRKDFKTYTNSKKYSVCERAANTRAWDALGHIKEKAHFAPWADIAWTAIKSIAAGGKTVGELVKENTEAELKKLFKDAIDSSPPAPEVKRLTFGGKCNTKSVTKWDAKTKKITIIVTGNCDCKYQKVGASRERVGKFEVRIEGNVKTAIRLKKSPLFWRDPQPQIQYGISKIRVITKAECNLVCAKKKDLVDPPEEDRGFFTGIIDFISGFFDTSEDPEDLVDPPEEDASDTKKDESVPIVDESDGEDDLPEELKGIKAFVDKLLGRDKVHEPEDQTDNTAKELEETKPVINKPKKPKPFACGDKASVNGLTVSTFSYRETQESDVNFSCNNSCSKSQICKVLPQSVRASGQTCVYCATKDYIPYDKVEKKKDKSKEETNVTCTIPNKQHWNNALMPGFKYTALDNKRVLVENSRTYCGMDSLAEFQKNAEATMRFFSCAKITTTDYKYTDIRGNCSFIATFGN